MQYSLLGATLSKKGFEWSPLHIYLSAMSAQRNSGGQREEGLGVVHHVQ